MQRWLKAVRSLPTGYLRNCAVAVFQAARPAWAPTVYNPPDTVPKTGSHGLPSLPRAPKRHSGRSLAPVSAFRIGIAMFDILDVTCGGRQLWNDKRHPRALYATGARSLRGRFRSARTGRSSRTSDEMLQPPRLRRSRKHTLEKWQGVGMDWVWTWILYPRPLNHLLSSRRISGRPAFESKTNKDIVVRKVDRDGPI